MCRPPSEAFETILLRRAAGGDGAAFGELHQRWRPVLSAAVRRVVGNPDEAEDVVQETFVALWGRAGTFDARRGRPLTWAMTVARHRAVDRMRALARRGRLHEEAGREALAGGAAGVAALPAPTAEAPFGTGPVLVGEMARLLRGAVRQLPPDQRAAIEQAFFLGRTQSEVARELGQPLGTIKARIRRGMQRLRLMIEGPETARLVASGKTRNPPRLTLPRKRAKAA